jgi:hypothetical protein
MGHPAAISSGMPATPISGQRVLSLAFMTGLANVPMSNSRFVCVEEVEGLRPALRQRSGVTVMRIETVVHMSVKAVMATEPRSRADKQTSYKPIWAKLIS